MSDQIQRLLGIMAKLRDPETGCEWDTAQNFETIAPYTIEEAYEVSDAIHRRDMADLREELGDLLFQIVFHARMAEEENKFAFEDVVRVISDKMEARHPHIFGDDAGGMDRLRWESIKANERAAKGSHSAMDGVAITLPALLRAQKLQQRAARDGFDWPDTSGPSEKIIEEMKELAEAGSNTREEEAGDFLFAAVNLVRAYGIDAETALKAANRKFERRYRAMEASAEGEFSALTLDEQEALWQTVKRTEAS